MSSKYQLELFDYMCDISEDCYCAGWMEGLEYVLWTAVISGPMVYGQGWITQYNINEMQRLSLLIDGWMVFDVYPKNPPNKYVPHDEWLDMYEKGKTCHTFFHVGRKNIT